jgi:hypothetical protein
MTSNAIAGLHRYLLEEFWRIQVRATAFEQRAVACSVTAPAHTDDEPSGSTECLSEPDGIGQ